MNATSYINFYPLIIYTYYITYSHNYIASQVDKFHSRCPTFQELNLTCAPDQAHKKKRALKTKVQILDTARNTYSFHF